MIEQDNLSTTAIGNTIVIDPDVASIDKNHKVLELRDDGQDNTLYQADVMDTNTIYEIKYCFDLKGATLEIPINSVLYFEDGGFQNGVIKGNDTIIIGYNTATLQNIVFKGTFVTDAFKINEDGTDEIFVPNNLSINWKSTASEPGLSYPYYKDIKGDYKRLSEITSVDILDVDDIRNKIDGYNVFANDKDHRCPIWYDETDDTWRYADGIKTEVNRYGTTEQRPKNIPIGFEYFDTTLNSPIWSNGATWVYPIGEGGGGGSTGSFTAEAQAVSLSSTTPASANVTLEQGAFKFMFGIPAGKDGKNGYDGNSLEVRYALTDGTDDVPPVVQDNRNPGSIWQTTMPHREDRTKAIWGTQALINANNGLVSEWSEAYLITGVDGASGNPVNYKTYVYKLSDTKPNKPTGNDPANPGDGWLDYPNTTGQWWQCIGNVNGKTELVESWGEVIPLNGKDGTAQDGKFTEFRFAKSTNDLAPSISRTLRNPGGNWTLQPPNIDITEGESLWLTSTIINPDDTLSENWSFPVRISGEQGPKGDTGPAGSQGVSGIPGKFIEVRFCLGTDSSYDGTSSPGSNREPSGWSLTTPKVTKEKPYIWFIQATIKYANNYDAEGYVNGSWSTPAMLSGKNGLDGLPGAQGRKGQIVYPAGVYNVNTVYETTEDKAPYVYDTNDGNFYVLNTIMQWKGTEQSNRYPNQATNTWTKFEGFEAVYTKIGIIANGLIGSAVFNGDYMFSQQGGGTTGNFEDFNPDDPLNNSNKFIPNICINFNTGEAWFGAGSTHLAIDGSGYFSSQNFKWNNTSCVIGSDSKKGLEFNYSTNEYKLFDGQMTYKDNVIKFGDKVIVKLPLPKAAVLVETASNGLAWTATQELLQQGYRTFISYGSQEEGLSDKIILPRVSSSTAVLKVGESITFINAARNPDKVIETMPFAVTILNYSGENKKIQPLSFRRFVYMGQANDNSSSYWGDEFGTFIISSGK